MRRGENLVDLEKCLKNALTLAIGGVDTEENEHCKVCPLSVYRSPRFPSTGVTADEIDSCAELLRGGRKAPCAATKGIYLS